jgi:NADH-quinone oxidoreductase subunit N
MAFTYAISSGDWARITPELALLVAALLVMLVDAVIPARLRGALVIIGLLGVLAALAGVVTLYNATGAPGAFGGMVTSDPLALLATLIVLVATGLALLLSPGYIERQGTRQQGEFYALVLLAATGMVLMSAATNLMIVFLGLELLSLPLYVLCAFAPGQQRAQEAGMKYFLLSSFASGFLLYGMALIYGATGATNLDAIHHFVATHALSATSFGPFLIGGMALLAVGLAFKVSAIPFHAWTPDVYQGAPTPVTALMSVGTKTAAFAALARIFVGALGPVGGEWQGIMIVLAIVTMVGGNILAATQTNVKRMLAYSSIAHAGYLLIGIALGTALGVAALFYYLGAYAVMNLGAFGVVLVLERVAGLGTNLDDYRGLATRRPGLAAALAVFLFALAGIPGTAGFVAKYTIFYAAVVGGHPELTIIGVIASMLGFYYYLRVVWAMYFVPAPEMAAQEALPTGTPQASQVTLAGLNTAVVTKLATAAPPLAAGAVIALALALIGTLALGIIPAPLISLARQAAGLP